MTAVAIVLHAEICAWWIFCMNERLCLDAVCPGGLWVVLGYCKTYLCTSGVGPEDCTEATLT